MRCIGYCTATSYQMGPLIESYRSRFQTSIYRDVLYVEWSLKKKACSLFFFPYGVVVFWNSAPGLEAQVLKELKEFETGSLDRLEDDEFNFSYGDALKVSGNEMILPNREVLTKLSLSHALAQSVKLGFFESTIQKRIKSMMHIPDDLAKKGKISLSRREKRKKMGEIFIERNSINLHFDVLDTPEFFWEYDELEPLYLKMANYLDLKMRVDVLNRRLNIVHELFDMLGNELDNQHDARLEWIIILLILFEVILSIFKDILKLI